MTLTSSITETSEHVRTTSGTITVCGYDNTATDLFVSTDTSVGGAASFFSSGQNIVYFYGNEASL